MNSADLTPSAKAQLDELGRAMQLERLEYLCFIIGGHTDATGTEAFNEELSEERALAVASYLMREFGIEPERLAVVGFGERQLLDPSQPESGKNRRVEIRLSRDGCQGEVGVPEREPPEAAPEPLAGTPGHPAIEGALAAVPCLAATATIEADGRVVLRGITGAEEFAAEALDRVEGLLGGRSVEDRILVEAAPTCRALAQVLRAVSPTAASPPSVSLNNPLGAYRDGDFLVLTATMPDNLGGYLYMDRIGAGVVDHLLPEPLVPDNALPPGGQIRIGVGAEERRSGVRDWQAAPPFGRAYLLAIASEHQLYEGLRAIEEPLGDYLPVLLQGLQSAGRTAVSVTPITVVERQ